MENKEIKIEDFISKEILDSMTVKEREIYDKIFLLRKEEFKQLTYNLERMKEIQTKLENL